MTMLDRGTLQVLHGWCHRHSLHWTALTGPDSVAAMLLEPESARRPWSRMMLQVNADGYRLCDDRGEILAEASDLPALFDALESGLAEDLLTAP
jgi:hypothetical protein